MGSPNDDVEGERDTGYPRTNIKACEYNYEIMSRKICGVRDLERMGPYILLTDYV